MPMIELFPKQLSLPEELRGWISDAGQMSLSAGGSIDPSAIAGLEQILQASPGLSQACQAGLWLLAGELDRSHTISQSIESADGSFWHGIMHRREGDYWNSKYWMRKVGKHPVLSEIARIHPEYEDPFSFIDKVEQAVTRQAGSSKLLQQIQWSEWQLLFAYCL